MSSSISEQYYGRPDSTPNLNNLFGSLQQGYEMGRNFADAVIQDQTSRRYGDSQQGFNHPDITSQYSYPRGGYYSGRPQQQQYHAPELDRYGWGPGRCGGYRGESLSRYPGIWMENYGSGGRL